MNNGFGVGIFTFGPIFIGVVFVLVIGTIIAAIISGVLKWNKNNHSPILTVTARVVGKRTDVSYHHHNTGNTAMQHTTTSTSYYTTFQVESGDRMEFDMDGYEYGMLCEGDEGRLTFQGTRYKSFERQ